MKEDIGYIDDSTVTASARFSASPSRTPLTGVHVGAMRDDILAA